MTRPVRPRPGPACAALVAAALGACGSGDHGVVVRFDREELLGRAAGVEVYLVDECGELGGTGGAPASPRLEARFRPSDGAPRLGRIETGSYGLYARVRDEACLVFASGCDRVEVSRGDEDLVVSVSEVDGPGCGPAEGCSLGLCEPGGDGDADLDADAEVDADTGSDADQGCGPAAGWTRAVEGSAHLPFVAIAPDGTVLVLGHFDGAADLDPGPEVDERRAAHAVALFVLALDPEGNRLWVRTIDGADGFAGAGIDVLDDGTAVVVGSFDRLVDLDPGPGRDERSSRGEADGFVLALDPSGERRWAGVFGGPEDDRALDVSAAGSSVVAVSGVFSGLADLDPGPGRVERSSLGGADGFVLLLDRSGSLLWAASLGGEEAAVASAVALSHDHAQGRLRGVLVAGTFEGTLDLDPGPGLSERTAEGAPDLFVLRLDPEGRHLWDGAVGGGAAGGTVELTDLVSAPGDDVVVYGELAGRVDLDPGEGVAEADSTTALADAFALRLNAAGRRQWAVTFGGEGRELATMAAAAPDSAVVLGGRFLAPIDVDPGRDEARLAPVGGVDGYLLRLDAFGGYVWGRGVGGSLEDFVGGVAVSREGWIAAAGVMTGSVDFDPGPCDDALAPAVASAVFVTLLLPGGTYRY